MMLNVYFGDMPEAIYNTNIYFNNTYKDSWIVKPLSKDMIKAVDQSDVIDEKTKPLDMEKIKDEIMLNYPNVSQKIAMSGQNQRLRTNTH